MADKNKAPEDKSGKSSPKEASQAQTATTSQAGQPSLVDSYKALAESNPTDRIVLHWLLMAYLSQKAYVDGISQFRKFVMADSNNHHAHMCLAVLYEKGGYEDEAIQGYRRVLALDPDEELAYLFLSMRLLLKGEYGRAVQVCSAGIKRFPRAERLHFNLGFALVHLKKFDAAIEAFQKEIEINPQRSEAYFNIEVIKQNKISAVQLGSQPGPEGR